MDKPKKLQKDIHFSGAHIFQNMPDRNHYDHFLNEKEWKEYSQTNKYPLKVEDNKIVLLE